jgi:hypothetical protein
MAAPGAFIVKERLEGLEARINAALDEAGLKDFSKKVAREAVESVIEEIVSEIRERKEDTIKELQMERIDVKAELETHLGRLDHMVKFSIFISTLALVAALFL